MLVFIKTCDNCNNREERVFVDSWTGLELCPMCLYKVMGDVTMSPASEGDNLKELLLFDGRTDPDADLTSR